MTDPNLIAKVERFCGDCHPNPSPSSFPRDQWLFEVDQGYQFYRESLRRDLDEPILNDTLRYFQAAAPEKVHVPAPDEIKNYPSPIDFQPSAMVVSSEGTSLTSHVVWEKEKNALLLSDMTTGNIRRWKSTPEFARLPSTSTFELTKESILATGKHSCRLRALDWNGDGLTDYLLGEIGSMSISDLKQGNVSLLIQGNGGGFTRFCLAENLARSFDAIPFDYDEDGDTDVLIAEFGRHAAGVFSMLRNEGASKKEPLPAQFKYEVIDPRHGLLGVEIADMDRDGRNDLVIAFGQEFETVEIMYNRGAGKYDPVQLHQFPDPSYNSSSIRVADIDADGRLDIVHTCGDIFDSFVPKPFHGVRVIFQEDSNKWNVFELGMLIGAMHSAIADFDMDGDLDIAGVGLFPNEDPDGRSYDSVVWWEQTPGRKFLRHGIERDHCYHASCEAADIDSDGRVDLVVGEWKADDIAGSLRVFWNRPKSKD